MVKLVRVLLVVLVCALLAGAVHAQEMKLNELQKQAEMVGQLIAVQLNITDAQQAKLGAIFSQTKQACETAVKGSGGDEAKVAAVQAAVDNAIKNGLAVLSDQQKSVGLVLGMSIVTQYGGNMAITIDGAEIKGGLVQMGLASAKAQSVVDAAKAHCAAAKLIHADSTLSSEAAKAKVNALRQSTIAGISGKLDSNEQRVMTAVLGMFTNNYNTFMSCLDQNQKANAVTLGEQIIKFVEQSVTIK